MKSFLKKMNRGVALAVILLIGLIIFFIIDSVTFAKEEPALKDLLEELLDDCVKINLLPEEYRKPGAEIPDGVVEAKTQEFKDFVEKYFTEYKRVNSPYYYSTRAGLLTRAEFMFESNNSSGYFIKDIEYSLVSISGIQKQSTNAVRISFKVNMKVSASYNAQYIFLTSIQSHGFDRYSDNNQARDEIKSESMEYDFTFILFKINGKWKIAESQDYGYRGGRMVMG